MADSKLSQLPELTVPAGEDLILATATPSTNPTSKKLTLATLFGNIPVSIDVTGGVVASANSSVAQLTTTKLLVNDDRLNIGTAYTPTTAVGAAGDKAGDVARDSSYLYVCVADYDGSASIWKRVSVASW
jgi:hypothetical protein